MRASILASADASGAGGGGLREAQSPEGPSLADLEALRRGLAGCETVLVADILTGTVLGVSTAVSLPQEVHDLLCSEAASALSLGAGDQRMAVLARSTGTRLFLRSASDPAEVLCIVLDPATDIGPAIEAAGSLLGDMRR